jgi:cell division protein FtsI (penicillin-binding protein 3)
VSGSWRYYFIIFVLILGALGLFWRLFDLSILQRSFLLQQSNARILRVVDIPAYRGMITDRYYQPLAVSAQVDSIWINPHVFSPTSSQIHKLALLLQLTPEKIRAKMNKDQPKEFIYLKRGIAPNVSEAIKSLAIQGLFCQHNYHRFYPESDITAHVIGFTNIDDLGQEGLELAYDAWLRGIPGKKKVLKDRLGNIITELDILREPKQGHNLTLSLDSRIQYLAYEELKENIQTLYSTQLDFRLGVEKRAPGVYTLVQEDASNENNNAENSSAKSRFASGSIVVLDVKTGEVLAMVNQPCFNPNHIGKGARGCYRNRAMTDMFEPGSTMKTFSIANALESNRYNVHSKIDTSPGWFTIGANKVQDENNKGIMDLVQILQHSSDVGVAKIILSLSPQRFYGLLHRVGFGESTESTFPGEASGSFTLHNRSPFELATLAFGYGISVTPIQLAKAYAIIAASGLSTPVSLLKIDKLPPGKQVLDPKIARQMLRMLEAVVQGGTGSLAKVPGYRVAGKTGTAYIAGKNGYDKQHYVSSFVGVAPASNPRLVIAVVVVNLSGKQHQGGAVAAPIFSKVMAGALRLLNIPPDDLTN